MRTRHENCFKIQTVPRRCLTTITYHGTAHAIPAPGESGHTRCMSPAVPSESRPGSVPNKRWAWQTVPAALRVDPEAMCSVQAYRPKNTWHAFRSSAINLEGGQLSLSKKRHLEFRFPARWSSRAAADATRTPSFHCPGELLILSQCHRSDIMEAKKVPLQHILPPCALGFRVLQGPP